MDANQYHGRFKYTMDGHDLSIGVCTMGIPDTSTFLFDGNLCVDWQRTTSPCFYVVLLMECDEGNAACG